MKGFKIVNMVDVTRDQALEHFKKLILNRKKYIHDSERFEIELNDIMRSYLMIPDVETSFCTCEIYDYPLT